MADFKPFVPEKTTLREFTFKAAFLGILMAIVLGAANAYLGLKAGMTVAATFPAAVVAMAFLRIFKGSILEENIARTTASVGEALVAGAIFTLPAFFLAGVWEEFGGVVHYLEATAIMLVGGVIGVLFVTLLRKIMVEEASLPYPESVAAAEIHKAGRTGGTGAKYLFGSMLIGGVVQFLAKMNAFATVKEWFIHFSKNAVKIGVGDKEITIGGGGGFMASTPGLSPALFGVGYIVGPRIAALAFSGGILAWGMLVPLLLYITGPSLGYVATGQEEWIGAAYGVWLKFVRPIAVGGMLCGTVYTLYKMKDQLIGGIGRAVGDLSKAAGQKETKSRYDHDLGFKWVLIFVGVGLIGMIALYNYFTGNMVGAVVAALVMIIAGFFFSAVAGYLVGLIGSSNNPISGLTLSTLIIAALLMVALGISGNSGIAAVLGVAAVVCCMCGVAGDMLQDLKVGQILGGTPWKMELGEILGVIFAAVIMFIPLYILHQGDIAAGGIGFGGRALPAPQAGLMAMLAKGIVGGQMAWPLIVVGIFFGLMMIAAGVPSPMLVAVGMYLPLETTFAMFIGGVIRFILGLIMKGKKLNEAQKVRVENNGTLIASGFIAGEALVGLLVAALYFGGAKIPMLSDHPSIWVGGAVALFLAWTLIRFPLKNAGRKDEPAPPAAMG